MEQKVKTLFQCLLVIAIIVLSIFAFTGCKKKKSYDELKIERKVKRSAIEKKLTKNYCYDITKIALGKYFSRIDTIIITKYEKYANDTEKLDDVEYKSAYVRTDGKIIGKIRDQEGTFTYWFETDIDVDNLDSKSFQAKNIFAEDQDGYYVICKSGINDSSVAELNQMNSEKKAKREFAKKMEQHIDGITVRFVRKSDLGGVTGLYYDSDKELSNVQMKKVAKNIKEYYDFVEFSKKGKSYAYYDREGGYVSHDLR